MSEAGWVYVIDDDDAVRDSLAVLFRTAGLAVRPFAGAREFLEAWSPQMTGCLVLDLKMPGMSGADLQAELSRRGAQLPILFLTAHGNIPASVRAIQHGAVDFIVKPPDPRLLTERVRTVLAETSALQSMWARLTDRERRIFACLAAGRNSKAIAAMLSISTRTVEGHRTHLMRKLGVRNALQLANLARRFDLSAYAEEAMQPA